MRVVIAEDSALLRDSLAGVLPRYGVDVVGTAATAGELEALVAKPELGVDAAIVDIRMPPTHTVEGLEATMRIRLAHPRFPVLVLSHHVESRIALDLIRDDPAGIGYLLKDRVARISDLVAALQRLTDGGSVIDPAVVSALLGRPRVHSPLDELTAREQQVLALMAEGRSNRAIAEDLAVEEKTVEYHVGQVFDKLGLDQDARAHRRVLAVLAWLSSGGTPGPSREMS